MDDFGECTSYEGGELDVEDAFSEHDIEYWVPRDGRLVPATPEQVMIIREHEALLRLPYWQQRDEAHRQKSPAARRIRAAKNAAAGILARLLPRQLALIEHMIAQAQPAQTPDTPQPRDPYHDNTTL